jgi:LacI family transcriptional regulator
MVTIKDVARMAGVSVTTVSRALNGYSDINEKTRLHILNIASELDFTPSITARRLVKRESRSFGYIVSSIEPSSKHTIFQDTLAGVYKFSREIDYQILIFAVDPLLQQKKSYLQFVREHGVEGIIVQGIRTDDAYYAEVMNSKLPCVLIDIPAQNVHVGSVSIDNYTASRDAVAHLASLGHKNIACINGKDAAAVSVIRYQGYVSMIRELGLAVKTEYIVTADFNEDVAYVKVKELIEKCPEITALFCASDLMAIGALRAISDCGRKVPEDVAVFGFDDILISSYITPPLSTIRQDFSRMGYDAAQMLYEILNGNNVPHTKAVPYEIIIRESTTPSKNPYKNSL